MRRLSRFLLSSRLSAYAPLVMAATLSVGCGRQAIVESELPLRRVVIYRNGVAYFERGGHIENAEVRFKMKKTEVGDFLATLAVMEQGGSSVRAAAFPLDMDNDNDDAKPKKKPTEDERRGLKTVVLSLDGRAHDLQVGYVAESPVWRPSYRLVVQENGEADLQAWGIVQNLSGEDWKNVQLSLVAGAPLSFDPQLGTPIIPERPIVTDQGEVIAAVPRGETSLGQDNAPAPPAEKSAPVAGGAGRGGAATGAAADGDVDDAEDATPAKTEGKADKKHAGQDQRQRGPARPSAAATATASPGAPPPPPMAPKPSMVPSQPRNLRSLAAIAVESGTTRYDIPTTVNVPDKSATMVMLLSKRVRGEAIFLFAPDGGVPDSASHPFRVARFLNGTPGVLERGPIAVFEKGSFLGQGMVDPLPAGATATVPFALERAIAIDQERKFDETGERVAKIENSQLFIERDAEQQTKYRVRNGGDHAAKVLVRHPRNGGARLYQPPKDTEDNVGTHTALVPGVVPPHATTDLIVDERSTVRRWEDWFTDIADNAVKAYIADPRADKGAAAKLTAAWTIRTEVVRRRDARRKLEREMIDLQRGTDETRRNIKAIEKSKGKDADDLRARLTKSLNDMVGRYDVINRDHIENNMKLTELEVRFREAIRDITIVEGPPPKQ